jgi:hypothetical protein
MYLTFREMQRQVAAKIQNTGTDTSDADDLLPKIKDWINTRYQRIYRSHYWAESIDDYSLQLTASTDEYAFDRDFEQLIGIYDTTNTKQIEIDTVDRHIRDYAPIYERSSGNFTGDPTRIRLTGVHTVKAELSTGDTIRVVSSDNSTDISPNCVYVQGKSGTGELGENITLTGTSNADGSITFDTSQKLLVSTGTTTGVRRTLAGLVTVSETTSGTVLARINPGEQAHKYMWFKTAPTPKSSGTQPTWEIWYQKAFKPLLDDNAIPLLDCCTEVVQGAFADALREDGLEQEAQVAENIFITMAKELQAASKPHHVIEQFRPVNVNVRRFLADSYSWVV